MSVKSVLAAAVLVPSIAIVVSAQQQQPQHTPNEFERRSSGSFTIMQSRPQGELAHNIHLGYGAGGAYLFRLDRAGFLSLRAEAGVMQYGRESKQVPLSETVGGRIQVRVATENNVVPVAIGPQIQWPRGSFRPYAHAGLGGQFFFTQSSIQGTSDTFDFANTTNQHDATGTWVAGGGVLIPVYAKRAKVSVDFGAEYLGGGRAQYLRPGSIEDLPDAQIRVTPLESQTRMVIVRLGVHVGI